MNNDQLINQDSGDYEYYTPIEIVNAARKVMGSIDLDPASSEKANEKIKALHYYKAEMTFHNSKDWALPGLLALKGGHQRPWYGNVWMNHPFARAEAPCKKDCVKKICRKRGYHTFIPLPGNKEWIDQLVSQVEAGNIEQSCNITYVNTSETWFRPLLDHLQCFIYGRTNYYLPDGTQKKGVTKGSVVTYFGSNTDRFREMFSRFGKVK